MIEVVIAIIIIAESVRTSSKAVVLCNPSMALFEILISNKSIGMIIGNPRIAIRIPLFDALEAILEIIVNVAENPMAPSIRLSINKGISCTGFPKRRM